MLDANVFGNKRNADIAFSEFTGAPSQQWRWGAPTQEAFEFKKADIFCFLAISSVWRGR